MDLPEGVDYCAHEIRPELVPNKNGIDGIKLTVIGHNADVAEADEVLFSFITSVPGAAVLASAILDESTKSDEVTQMITSMALARHELDKSPVQNPADDPMAALAALMIGEEKPRGVAAAVDPVRLVNFGDNPGGRPTLAPVDNRDEYPGIGDGGYL
jgi:hypothetical protein